MIGTKPSGSATSFAPPAAASAISAQAFSTEAGPSSTTGVACTTATRSFMGRLLVSRPLGTLPHTRVRSQRRERRPRAEARLREPG